MRPSEGLLRTFHTLLFFTACLVLIGLVFALSVSAQGTKRAPVPPVKKSEQGVLFKQMAFSKMIIGDNGYAMHPGAVFYAVDGRPIKPFQVKAGQWVDVVYLIGGTRTEGYPYDPKERVLLSLRVVPKPRQ